MNIAFLVAGNNKIGLGHLYRCRELSLAFKNLGHSIKFFLPKSTTMGVVNFEEVELVSEEIWNSPFNNPSFFKELLKKNQVVVLDLIEKEYQSFSFLSKIDGFFLVSLTLFDFPEKIRFENVSYFPDLQRSFRILPNGTVLKSGPEFIIIRKSFSALRDISKKEEQLPKILLAMGGSDPLGITLWVLKALKKIETKFLCDVIVGAANSRKQQVKNLIGETKNFFYYENVSDFEKFVFRSKLAIINGGITRYELTYLKTPYIAISIHEKQFEINERVTNKFGGINLGIFKQISHANLQQAVEKLLNDSELYSQITNKMENAEFGSSASLATEILNMYWKWHEESN